MVVSDDESEGEEGDEDDDEEEEEEEEGNAVLNCRGDINILLCGDPGTRSV